MYAPTSSVGGDGADKRRCSEMPSTSSAARYSTPSTSPQSTMRTTLPWSSSALTRASASNDLVLSDPTVSKHHVEIAVVPEGYRIGDLGSSNGTLVGAARLGALTVVEPVTLQLGASVVRIEPTDEESEVPASPRTHFGS